MEVNSVIAFDNYVGKDATTKAAIVEGVTSVNVNAYLHYKTTAGGKDFEANFMENQKVEKSGDANWTYTPAKYWPAVDQAVDFVAWVPVQNAVVENATLTFTVPSEDVTKQTDLLVAEPVLDQNRAGDNSAVNLKFHHLLSRIGFSIIATGMPGQEDKTNIVELVEVKLNGKFAQSGTVDMTKSPVVTGTPAETSYTLTGANFGYTDNIIIDGTANNKADSYIMLIPSDNDPDSIEITYTVTTKAEGQDDVVITNYSKFDLDTPYQAGKAYRYNFSITMQAISFSVEETPWEAETSTDITPDNE